MAWGFSYWKKMSVRFFDLQLNEKFTAGMVDVRPLGTKHGPWKLPN